MSFCPFINGECRDDCRFYFAPGDMCKIETDLGGIGEDTQRIEGLVEALVRHICPEVLEPRHPADPLFGRHE